MPIYTYECPNGHRFEDIGRFEEHEKACPTCNNQPLPENSPPASIVRAARVPSVPSPAQFNCSMPTYQKPKT